MASRILTVRQRIADIERRRADLRQTLETENRPMTADERTAAKAEETELVALRDEERFLAEGVEAERRQVASIVQVRDRAADDPMRGFTSPRDFLTAVMSAARGVIDERLKPLQATAGSDEQGAYNDAYGGFFMPRGISPNLLSLSADVDPTAALCTPVPMSTPILELNARVDKDHTSSVSGGLVVTRKPETVDATSSRMQFEQVTLRATDQFGLAFATEKILRVSPVSFMALLEAGFRDEFAAADLEERLWGTGAGEPMGVMKSPALVTVAKETNQAADSIVPMNIDKMIARCWRYGQSVWMANHDTLPQLTQMTIAVGTGGQLANYLQTTPGGGHTLKGRPIYFTERCATVGDLGDLILVDWSQYLKGTYQTMEQAESIHVRFVAHERTFKFWQSNDGQPWWRAPLTPKRGTNTLSPIVSLAAR